MCFIIYLDWIHKLDIIRSIKPIPPPLCPPGMLFVMDGQMTLHDNESQSIISITNMLQCQSVSRSDYRFVHRSIAVWIR